MLSISKIGKYIKAGRLFSLPCSLFPIVLGYLLSDHSSNRYSFSILSFISTAVVLVHVASNLFNTYYDFKYKVDDKEHSFDDTLVNNILHEDEVLNAAWLCLAFSMMFFGSGVVMVGSAHFIPYALFFKAIFFGYNYSSGFKFKHNCLGEVAVYIIFGPCISTFVYSCLSKGNYSWVVLIASSPLGLLIASILFANNVRDAGHDLKSGVKTVANQLGIKSSLNLYSLLLFMPYVQISGLAVLYQHFSLLLIWLIAPVTLYIATCPHRQSCTDGISSMFDRTLVNFHVFASVYLALIYYTM